jgi:hypothetical protein
MVRSRTGIEYGANPGPLDLEVFLIGNRLRAACDLPRSGRLEQGAAGVTGLVRTRKAAPSCFLRSIAFGGMATVAFFPSNPTTIPTSSTPVPGRPCRIPGQSMLQLRRVDPLRS